MKKNTVITVLLAVVTLLVLVAGVYCLVMSIKGEGNIYLTIALGLVFLGNLLNLIAQKVRRKK